MSPKFGMGRDKIFDPAFQKAFTESIFKEQKVKAKWHLDHGSGLHRVPDTCLWDDDPDDDETAQLPPTISRQHDQQRPLKEPEGRRANRDAGAAQKPDTGEQSSESEEEANPMRIMKPVGIRTKKLLYKGSSHDEEGKVKYLKKRTTLDPEEKYRFPVCSSWDYGWTYGHEYALKGPDYGRREIIKKTFFRHNDPQLRPRR